jgi:hypothetical protein
LERIRQDVAALAQEGEGSEHPDEESWVCFASGDLQATDRDRLIDHVLACTECAAVYRAVREVGRGALEFDPAALRPHTSTPRVRSIFPYLAVAAGLTIAAGGAYVFRANRPSVSVPADQVVARAPSTPPVVAAVAPRSWARGGQAPEVRLPASLALTVRGTDRERDALLAAFGNAIAPYRQGRYPEAAEALALVATLYPNVPEVAFYLGVSRLFAGDAASAIEPLRAARNSTVLSQDARWYEAVALERSGGREDADAALRELCKLSGPYQERSCAVMRGLQ